MSEQQWKLVPVEPTDEMLRPLDRFMRPEAARELLKEVLAAAPQPPAHELLASLERFESDGEDFVKLHDVHDVVAMIKQPPALGGEPEVLAVLTLGGVFDNLELGDNDIGLRAEAVEALQEKLVRTTDDVHVELVDRAHVARLQAKSENHKFRADLLFDQRNASDDKVGKLQARNAALERALSGLLFEFDDGVNGGRDEPVPALDHARTLIGAAEFKPAEGAKS